MLNLQNILTLIGYKNLEEQLAYIKLMAYRDFFSKPQLESEEKFSDLISLQKRNHFIRNALSTWQKTGLKEVYVDRVINDDSAAEFLQIPFDNWEEGFEWLFNMSEVKFLRKHFFAEGIGLDKEKTPVNLNRWQDSKEDEKNVYPSLKTLGLVSSPIVAKLSEFQHVVLFSNLEHVLKERIDYLPSHIETLYCLTGPRGLFNFEASLPAILATQWFKKPEYEPLIREVLNEHKDDEYQWCRNLSGLKQKILDKVGEAVWPKAEHSQYYSHKHIYDQAAKLAKREPLDCLGGAWPVAMDLIYFLVKDKHIANIKPVIALGKEGRLAGVADEIEAWYQLYGRDILNSGKNPLFVASNSIHAIQYIKTLLSHDRAYQDGLTKRKLTRDAQQFPKTQDNIGNQIIVAGPEGALCRTQDACDALAKMLYAIKTNLKELIQIHLHNLTYHDRSMLLAQRMISFHHFKNHINLADSAFALANVFYSKNEFTNSVGLINFAVNILSSCYPKDVLIDYVEKCSLIVMQAFLRNSSQILFIPEVIVGITDLERQKNQHKYQLRDIRKKIKFEFDHLHINNMRANQILYQKISHEMKKFIHDLLNESVALYNCKPRALSYLGMGSYGRKQQTPFSDLESCIIVDEDSYSIKYAKELTKLLLINILNLGETVLPSLGIVIRENKQVVSFLGKIFDTDTKQGVCFDRGDITPLATEFQLIASPQIMAEKSANHEGAMKNIFLPQLLRSSQLIFGDASLFADYLALIRKSHFDFSSYSEMLLRKDIEEGLKNMRPGHVAKKQAFYRPVVTFIDNLSMHLNLQDDLFAKIEKLQQVNILSLYEKCILEKVLTLMQYLRLQQHFKFGEQNTQITTSDRFYPVVVLIQESMRDLYNIFLDRLAKNENARLRKENYLSCCGFFNYRTKQINSSNCILPDHVSKSLIKSSL